MYRGAIVGFGPAGLGPLVAAAQAGALNKWLRDGLVIFESSDRAGFGKFGQYLITANTTAAYTLDPFRETQTMTPALQEDLKLDVADPIMAEIRTLPTFKLLDDLCKEGGHVKGTLRQYGEFIEEVAQLFLKRIEESGTSKFYSNTTVHSLQLHGDEPGSLVHISAHTSDGTYVSVDAKSVLLATGGVPKMPSFNAKLNAKLRSSDYIQREAGMAEVEGVVKGKGSVKIAVIGGSHSAFSASKLLLDMLDGSDVKVEMLSRDTIRVFYESVAIAEQMGYEVNPDSVCKFSGQVNRYGGIRPPVRELYQEVLAGTEKRLRFLKCGVGMATEAKFFDALERADLIVPAFGYVANWPRLLDPSGEPMEWALDRDGQALMNNSTSQLSVKVKATCLGDHTRQLPNVFGAGLGFGLKSGGAIKIGEPGVRIDGQAQYHSWVGMMGLNGMAKSTLDGPFKAPEDALLCAVFTTAWVRTAKLWTGLAKHTPSHGYGWDSISPFQRCPKAAKQAEEALLPDDCSFLPEDCSLVFADWDLDGNGELSASELTEKLQDIGMPSSVEQLNKLVRTMDEDDKGHVVASDLSRFFTHMDAKRMEEAVASAFACIDSDGDGYISLAELQAHVGRFGRTYLTPHEGMLMLNAIGRENVGRVGIAEFSQLCSA